MTLYEKPMSVSIARNCEIVRIQITGADKETHHYRGNISYIDHAEDWRGTDEWTAEPGEQVHEVSGRTYHMVINPVTPVFAEKGKFTLQPDIDRDLRHHIMHTILDYNPDL